MFSKFTNKRHSRTKRTKRTKRRIIKGSGKKGIGSLVTSSSNLVKGLKIVRTPKEANKGDTAILESKRREDARRRDIERIKREGDLIVLARDNAKHGRY
jgi:hypothetical protein